MCSLFSLYPAQVLAARNHLDSNDENYGTLPAGKAAPKQATFAIHMDEPDCANYRKQPVAKKPVEDEQLKQLNKVVVSLGQRKPLEPLDVSVRPTSFGKLKLIFEAKVQLLKAELLSKPALNKSQESGRNFSWSPMLEIVS